MEDLIRYILDELSSDHFFFAGANMEELKKTELTQSFTVNIKVFAWTLNKIVKIANRGAY